MYFDEFMFTPQIPVAASQGTFGLGLGASDMQRLSVAVKTGLENAQSGRNIDLQQFNPVTQQGTLLEVIQHYGSVIVGEFLYLHSMALYNNELTKVGGVQQNQQFVLSPLNSSTLLI